MPNPPNVRESAFTSRFRWNESAARYIRSDGSFVSQESIKRSLNRLADKSKANMGALTKQLQDGDISLADWQRGMATEIKTAHLASVAAGRGGWAQMNPSDWGYAGSVIKKQYQYLENFGNEIANGKQKMDGTLKTRADLYGEAARATWQQSAERTAKEYAGMKEESNVLGRADHCKGCLTESGRGWVPIGTLVPIGERDCIVRCHCHMAYR